MERLGLDTNLHGEWWCETLVTACENPKCSSTHLDAFFSSAVENQSVEQEIEQENLNKQLTHPRGFFANFDMYMRYVVLVLSLLLIRV